MGAGTCISVSCENGKLVITPDVERAALEEAEAAFMEKETKILQKKEFRDHYDAECNKDCCVHGLEWY